MASLVEYYDKLDEAKANKNKEEVKNLQKELLLIKKSNNKEIEDYINSLKNHKKKKSKQKNKVVSVKENEDSNSDDKNDQDENDNEIK